MTLTRATCLAAAAALALAAAPARAASNAGDYLAARHAGYASDFESAAIYFTRALMGDPANPALMESAIASYVSLGELDRAVPVAQRLTGMGASSQVAHIVLSVDQIERGAFDALIEAIDGGRTIGPLADGLLAGWAAYGAGRMSDALERFGTLAELEGVEGFALYHKALALAAAGDYEGAEAILGAQPLALASTRRGAFAHAEILSQLDRNAEALQVLSDAFGTATDPSLEALRARLAAGDRLPFTAISSAAEGVAEVFFNIATAIEGDAADDFTLLYAQAASYLHPGMSDAVLMVARLMDRLGRHELAEAAYARIPADDPAFYAAALGRADALRAAGLTDEAIAALTDLAETHADVPAVHARLGDLLRAEDRLAEAVDAYDRAVALYEAPAPGQWFTYFARGIAHHDLDDWPAAEADFRTALDLNPGQPQVLNYLGYSMVERQERLGEALELIEEAVQASPESGYIVDSLGWALYRLGRYEEAVPHMERAVELEPAEPIINDHLGDVYWAVGRFAEARFQWNRALSFGPEPEEAERIRRKLEVGLDQVLAEEGEPPLQLANDDG